MYRSGSKRRIRSLTPVCEDNYRLMMHWLPGLRGIRTPVTLLLGEQPAIRLSILECSRYTSVAFISQTFGRHVNHLLRDISLRFRLYHDAHLLEVISCQGRNRLAPIYPWPNPEMLAPFEKRQVNLFMGEWLRARMRLGRPFADADEAHLSDLKVEN